jgi:hypothetical protein
LLGMRVILVFPLPDRSAFLPAMNDVVNLFNQSFERGQNRVIKTLFGIDGNSHPHLPPCVSIGTSPAQHEWSHGKQARLRALPRLTLSWGRRHARPEGWFDVVRECLAALSMSRTSSILAPYFCTRHSPSPWTFARSSRFLTGIRTISSSHLFCATR